MDRVHVRPTLVVIAGPPCTGKTALAAALHAQTGGACLDVDAVRQALFPHSDQSERDRDAAYGALHLACRELLRAGASPVIASATYTRATQRRRLTEMAESQSADVLVVECRVDPDTAVERFLQRPPGHAAVDLTPELVRQSSLAYPFVPALRLDTTRGIGECVAEIRGYLKEQRTSPLADWCAAPDRGRIG